MTSAFTTPAAAPDFVIAGAPKCGTTSLHQWLNQHPDVFMLPGEPHFFAHDLAYNDPPMTPQRYTSLLGAAGAGQQRGERSTWYLYSSTASAAIHAANPSARIIILVRQPAEMLHSVHAHYCRRGGRETAVDLRQAMALEGQRRQGRQMPPRAGFREKFYYSMLPDYAAGIDRFIHDFGLNRIRVVLFDDLRDRPAETLAGIEAFLGLAPDFQPDLQTYNRSAPVPDSLPRRIWRSGTWRHVIRRLRPAWWETFQRERKERIRAQSARERPWPPLDLALRNELNARFDEQISALEDLIGRDLSRWRSEQSVGDHRANPDSHRSSTS